MTLRIDGAVAYVLFDRPWARNAMTLAIYDGLATASRQLMKIAASASLVLRRWRQGFCSPPTGCSAGNPVLRKCNANGLVWKTEVHTFTPLQSQN